MMENRIRCSGKGRKHQLHVYPRTADRVETELAYLEKQSWTQPCRPFFVEVREVSEWTRVGPPHPSLFNVGDGEWISEA